MQAWKYTLPAFLVPFVFVLDPHGVGLLLEIPKGGTWFDVVLISLKAAAGLAAISAGAQGWAIRRTTRTERGLLVLAGLFLVFPSLLEAPLEAIVGIDIAYPAIIGLAIAAGVLVKQIMQPDAAKAPA
jgi:TRAP-type uncharacterized transport system fused permease subunit